MEAKKRFEHLAHQHGIKVQRYCADNVPFGSKLFRAHVKAHSQELDFSGVGAHHQNGVAEQAIQTATSWAPAMMIHAILHWPDQADLSLWPFAFEHAVYLWNHLPKNDSHLSPTELFSGVKQPYQERLIWLHVWGCPTYVLDPRLQDGKKIRKWQPRARRGQFLGYSQKHSSQIRLIRNLNTGYILPQYHVVYNDKFTTVPSSDQINLNSNGLFKSTVWEHLVQTGYKIKLDNNYNELRQMKERPKLHEEWLTPEERLLRERLCSERKQLRQQRLEHQHPQNQVVEEQPPPTQINNDARVQDIYDPSFDPEGVKTDNNSTQSSEGDAQCDHDTPTLGSHKRTNWQQIGDSSNYGRGKCQKRPNQHYMGDIWANYRNHKLLPKKVRTGVLYDQYLHSLNWEQTINMVQSGDLQSLLAQIELETDPDAGMVEALFPMALAAKANADDNPNWDQAMNGPNAKGNMKACKIELNTLEGKEAWDIIPRQPWMNVLPGTWAFKCKRYPNRMVRKLKAWFCVCGDRQVEGVDFFDTFVPVIKWQTVRLMLILSLILNLQTKQVDYTAAFLHAPIDKDPNWDTMNAEERDQGGVYVQMPRGFSKPGKVLKLKRSLYRLKQLP